MSKNPLQKALDALPAKSSPALRQFLEEFFRKIPKEDLALMSPAMIAQTAETHWEMSRKRKKGQHALRIHTTARVEHDEAGTGKTIIDIVNDDMAFLVDSVASEIGRHGRLISLLLHPVLHARFDKKNGLKEITAAGDDTDVIQSHMHIELQGAVAQSQLPQLEADLLRILHDVHAATKDWLVMREKLRTCQQILGEAPEHYAREDVEEYIHFLEYLYKDNFTLLGYREYKFVDVKDQIKSETVKGSSLGLLADDVTPVYISEDANRLPQELQRMRREQKPLTIAKVNRRSTVHRPVPLDAIAIKRYDKNGKAVGECLFIGLFTSVTYSRSIQDIPLLRRKADYVLAKSGFRHGGHNFKALRHTLEKYPRDELFQMDRENLLDTALSILLLQERQRIALYTRKDPFGRYISCLVYIPRDRYETRLRQSFQKILEESLGGVCEDVYTSLDDSVMARVIYIINTNQSESRDFNTRAIEARLQDAGRVWSERLAEALLVSGAQDRDVPEITHKYGEAFPLSYREEYTPKQAVYDIQKIEEALSENRLALDLYRCKTCNESQLRLKLYNKGTPVILSDILPVLENMGLHVISELPFEVRAQDGVSIWIHDFMMTATRQFSVEQVEASKAEFEEALLRVWNRDASNDSLNRLVLGAQMDWRDVLILRTYVHYLRQARSTFSTRFIERTLYKNAEISRHLVDLFKAWLDPDAQKQAEKRATQLLAAIDKALEKVESLEEDRILRSILGMIKATVRTNFFQPARDGVLKSYVSIKLDSRSVQDLPDPRPYREIYLYSPRVEGIHLRGDVISRGGIRWSDRFEDFRTEVLSLMKAQQVKNSIIVPMGAKGGFIVKKPPATGGRPAYLQEGIECYKLYVRSLLEITDNRKGKRVVPPHRVVRRDGDDPYLVVAADKGTATFSDIANSLSLEFDFWLGDAFASGGSAGYDHKKMGITARGAWESVKRHFRELNHDTQTQAFDVIGVGDMGGDVFGNGMLLSEQIHLVGAFNHQHIFCDPTPDAASSFAERKRLFEAVRGWDGYDLKKLSKGGRIYERSEKSLQLTPEIMKRFDITQERVTPSELIQAMLRGRAELLWFGGIGTYVKATHESHADVGDKGNDALRINADEIRAKVLGEGANLAVTQAARIQFAERGGKLNADFIDNSGGVNSSDLEVNIKILLRDVMANDKNDMSRAKRDKLLSQMTDEVGRLVLRNSYQQVQGISLMEFQAAESLGGHEKFIEELERRHGLKRRLEGLPDHETIQTRQRAGKGLTRPELAILQAHAKILLTRTLLATDIPEVPEMEGYCLFDYFPVILSKKYADEIRGHRLRREIVATSFAMGLVNRMGPTFLKDMMDKTGASAADVAQAYLVVREAFDLRTLWGRIESLDNKVPALVQMNAMRAIKKMVERETLWFLTRLGRPISISADIQSFRAGIQTLREHIDQAISADRRAEVQQRKQAALKDGLPEDLAHQVALISPMGAAFDIIRVSMDNKTDMARTARIYFELGDYFHTHWLRQQTRALIAEGRWSNDALEGLIESFYRGQTQLATRILSDTKKDQKAGAKKNGNIVAQWVEKHAPQAAQFEEFFSDLRRGGTPDLSQLVIAEQRLRQLAG